MSTPPSMAILIATYRRPKLLWSLLSSIGELDYGGRYGVFVVDNDPEATAISYLKDLKDELSFPLQLSWISEVGIAQARNACVELASGYDVLCFVDDDEVVRSDWLSVIAATLEACSADGVSGPVISRFVIDPPPFAILGGFFDETHPDNGTTVTEAATNNLALKSEVLDGRIAPPFDIRFSRTGGSDIFLTSQLAREGFRIVWSDQMVVEEHVPADRTTTEWISSRAIRGGNTHGRVALLRTDLESKPGSARRRIGVLLSGLSRVILGAGGVLIHPRVNHSKLGARSLRIFLRGIGFCRAAIGKDVYEYSQSKLSQKSLS